MTHGIKKKVVQEFWAHRPRKTKEVILGRVPFEIGLLPTRVQRIPGFVDYMPLRAFTKMFGITVRAGTQIKMKVNTKVIGS